MKVSLSWLNQYVSIEMEPDALAEALTMAGLEVEVVSDRYDYLDSVLVGRIAETGPHPNADRLRLCKVDPGAGHGLIPVVCGAPNAEKGMSVPLALPGMVFPDGRTLEQGLIRGERSEGMLCSEAELGLGTDESGLMVLDASLTPGEKLAKALSLSDMVFEIGLTPNRPDCLSMIGVAREIAAIQKTELRYPDVSVPSPASRTPHISELSSVKIEAPDHCPRYAARLLTDIEVGPSPFWLQDRLMSVGIRPISNIVDITNFVMMEQGQPLHAFDFDHLAENRIVVRTAREGEPFTTLDRKERALSSDMLMICDGQKPVAVGGVMGGLNSEIEDSTTRVLIESAYFDPISIRKTSKRLGLNTEASHRFERGIDPSGSVRAADRAAQLMVHVAGAKLVDGVIDEHPRPMSETSIRLSVKAANRLLGTALSRGEMADMLASVEFAVEKDADRDMLLVTPPFFRVDVSRAQDLMEEVARISGYKHIPTTFPMIPGDTAEPAPLTGLRYRIKDLMTGFGFTEAVSYSFIHRQSPDRLRLSEDDERRRVLDILNPLTEDQAVMRTSLIPGLLESVFRNISQQVRNLRLFEIGKIFISRGQDKRPREKEMFAGLWTGSRFDASWHSKDTPCDFYDIKGIAQGLLEALKIENAAFTRLPDDSCAYTRPGHTARIFAGDQTLGRIGEVHPLVLRKFDIKQKVFIFEMEIEPLISLIPEVRQSAVIPKYPFVTRDTTIIVSKNTEAGSLLENVRDMGEELVEDLYLFGIYEGDPIPRGMKSVSFRIVYRSHEETLEDEMVSDLHKSIADKLLKEFDASLPA